MGALMTKRTLSAALALAALSILSACEGGATAPAAGQAQGAAATPRGLPDNDSALAHKLVGEGGLLIDVRTPEEFSGKHIQNAVNIPVDDLEARMAEVEKLAGGDKKKPIVVYCSSGGRSRAAKKMLRKAGYEQVSNLGPMSNW
jgi:phage shock protein E